jgi:hypothetical protein
VVVLLHVSAFSAIFSEVLDFFFEYIPEDDRKMSKHVAELTYVCMILDGLVAAFRVPLASPVAR